MQVNASLSPRLSEIWTHASVTMMKIYRVSMTSNFGYDLREHVCYCSVGCVCPLHYCLWPCLPCIMNYQLCMTHDLDTANRQDHAWTENWDQNICTLCTPLSPMRPWYAHRQGDRRGHLYGTEGTWINYPTCFPLLNVGFMTILRRTDCFILIWTCSAVLTDHRQLSFSNLSRLQNETHKNKNVVLFAAMLCLRNDVYWAAW